MRKDLKPPTSDQRNEGKSNIEMHLREHKAFDWFCHTCAQLLSGVYGMHERDIERPADFPECRSCGLGRES